MMRILYHHRTLGDGAESIHIQEMVEAFRAAGHVVRVCGLAAGRRAARTAGVVTSIRRILPVGVLELGGVACNATEYLEVAREIRKFRPDFLYKRHARNDVGALLAARRQRVRSVLEVNCLFSSRGYEQFEPLAMPPLSRRLERAALRLGDVIVAVSSPLAAQIRPLTDRPVLVLPNGADPDRFQLARADGGSIRSRYGLSNVIVVGWTGILREWHGLELLLEAVARVPQVAVLVVGDGAGRAPFLRRAAALGMADRVRVTGRVPHDAMADYVAAMDVAVVADERTGVASPMKLLEYMAMARGVVAPDLENIRDIVTDGVDGLLFPAGDAAGLAGAIARLASDPVLRGRLGGAARAKIERTLNWKSNAHAVLTAIRADGVSDGGGDRRRKEPKAVSERSLAS